MNNVTKTKRKYTKPVLKSHGSIEEVTGWAGSGTGEFFGGSEGASTGGKVAFKNSGPGISH